VSFVVDPGSINDDTIPKRSGAFANRTHENKVGISTQKHSGLFSSFHTVERVESTMARFRLSTRTMAFLLIVASAAAGGSDRKAAMIRIDEENVRKEDANFWSRLLEDGSLSLSLPTPSTPPSTTSPPTTACVPTSGPCVASQEELVVILDNIESDSVVTLCGNTTIKTSTSINITQSKVTLCCEATGCLVKSQGSDRNLMVTGTDFTLQGVDFAAGRKDASGEIGGNVAIWSAGHHIIRNCTFSGGSSGSLGGNLFVGTPNNLTIERSVFELGQSRNGGGLAVLDASGIVLKGCTFAGNVADNGGGFIVYGDNVVDQEIYIYDSTFERNEAFFGGGFLATSFGLMPRLDIQLTTFNDNAAEDGAVAAVFHFVKSDRLPLDLRLQGNNGMNNEASTVCNGFYIFLDSSGPDCFDVSDDYP
jgi:hypothetical protein